MGFSTEEILHLLLDKVSAMDEVRSIGISGSKTSFPKPGEGDIDVFIYCGTIPESEKRKSIINQMGDMLHEEKIDFFEGGHWGIGDFMRINGVETWLMYFSEKETISEIESILNGDYPDKIDNYYYPVGRCAMLKDIRILFDKDNFLSSLKEKLSQYPNTLAERIMQYHLGELQDTEDLERAVNRKDVLFYHFAIDIAIDHFLQALFAVNKTYFPSRKRTLNFIRTFNIKPERCEEQLLDVVRLGSCAESIEQSYEIWRNMVSNLKDVLKAYL